jgi:hypothetical protein
MRDMGFSCEIVMNHAGFKIIVPPCRIFYMRPHDYAPPASGYLLPQQADARFLKQSIFAFLIHF